MSVLKGHVRFHQNCIIPTVLYFTYCSLHHRITVPTQLNLFITFDFKGLNTTHTIYSFALWLYVWVWPINIFFLFGRKFRSACCQNRLIRLLFKQKSQHVAISSWKKEWNALSPAFLIFKFHTSTFTKCLLWFDL